MLQLTNDTPFRAERCVKLDQHGNQILVVAVKATFLLDGAPVPTLHPTQEAVCYSPAYAGEPGRSSLVREGELVAEHPGTDIVLNASAYAPNGRPAETVDVSVTVGPVRRTLRVFGDRHWQNDGDTLSVTPPRPFVSMPVLYERAYGGVTALSEGTGQETEARNPIGMGFASRADFLVDKPLPNIEDPAMLIDRWDSRPAPAGLGAVPSDWSPRREYAGSFTAEWRRRRAPLWPADYDPRHQLSAHPDLVSAEPLRGGEEVQLTNLTPSGSLAFRLPRFYLTVHSLTSTGRVRHKVQMDRVIIEPDEQRLLLVWRSVLNCRSDARQVARTTVSTKRILR